MGMIGIKYCGGCNPRIDRAGLVRKLETLLPPEDGLDILRPSMNCSLAVLVCGCEIACADRPEVRRLARRWIVVGGSTVDHRDAPEDQLAEVVVRRINALKKGDSEN